MAELNSELSVSTETDFISSGKGRQQEGELSQQQKDDIIRQMLPPRLPTPRTQRTIEFNPSMAPVAVLENFEQAVQKLPTPKGIINDLAEIKATVGTENLPNILAPVVKIYCNHVYPNYSMPWQMRRQQKSTSSGFAIAGRQLLTNAHGIDFHTSVRVRKYGSATKFQAKVLHIGQECDLAILTVADDAFWKDLPIFEFGDIPQLQDSVTVVGYPTGGDNISVTRGVVSRIDVQEYSHASCRLLAVQIDAAINPGNSGGPAVKDNKVIGVAFEALEEAENIGYIIPTPVITHFLRDIERHRRYTGFPGSGFRWQQLESQHLKRYLHVSEQQTGILVNDVFPLAPAAQHLQRDDVILSIDSVDIADDGTIAFRGGERVNFMHAITSKFVGDSCDFEVLRNGRASHVTIRLAAPTPLVPIHCDSKAPSYLIYGGMVFVPLNRPYLINEYTKNWDKRAPIGLCELAFGGQLSEPEDQAVILSQVLAGEVNVGYHNVANIQLLSFNGQRVRNLRHLKELLDANQEEYVRFDLYQNKAVVLKVDEVERAKEDLNKEHNISASMSHDLTQSATPKIRQDVAATKPKETTSSSASSIDKKKLIGESDMAAPMVK